MGAASAPVDEATISVLRAKLRDPSTTLPQKYRVLFSLRNIVGPAAHEALLDGLKDPSELFRHEVAYVLGQRQDPAAIDALRAILEDGSEHAMVRHEAGESLGAIGSAPCLAPLQAFQADAVLEVAQTCQLALQRMAFLKDESAACSGRGEVYASVDPTPPAPASTPTEECCRVLVDDAAPIFARYRAMFALRDRGGAAAVDALARAMETSSSALLAHEVAYVLGQMQDARGVDALARVLRDATANAMVRHEAAEALGAIADDRARALLQEHCADPEPIVADSCIVALDVLEYEQRGDFQYADMGVVA